MQRLPFKLLAESNQENKQREQLFWLRLHKTSSDWFAFSVKSRAQFCK
jgi:hypothetical protein